MANQNDNPTIDDLDLSGIEGFGDESIDESPIEVDDTPVQAPDAPSATDEGPISWSSLEKLVPEPLHEDLRPVVDEWRRQYERVLDETNPYRQIAARGVTQADIETALVCATLLSLTPAVFTTAWVRRTAGRKTNSKLLSSTSSTRNKLPLRNPMPRKASGTHFLAKKSSKRQALTPIYCRQSKKRRLACNSLNKCKCVKKY